METASQLSDNPIGQNSYRNLPAEFYSDDAPAGVSQPQFLILNQALLAEYGIASDWLASDDGLALLSGNSANPDNPPMALAYAGYQFGHRVPLLGDGRAHLLGQMQTLAGLVDVHLKGSGRTRYSRGGDGRATLSSVLREYIISEAMAGLGIPTTRSLAVIATSDTVMREYPEKGGILVRTAASHIRVGTFHYAADDLGAEAVRSLADHVIAQHYPDIKATETPYSHLLAAVIERQAELIAQWMLVGFIHGVMNTDNMSVAGETIDFGPCAFMDEFNTEKVFSSIDQRGRYAWGNQPGIGLWNLTRFAESLLPLLGPDAESAKSNAEELLSRFNPAFQKTFYAGLRDKLALPHSQEHATQTLQFADNALMLLHEHAIDYTVFFDRLTRLAEGASAEGVIELFDERDTVEAWLAQWQDICVVSAETRAAMRAANPALVARNHRVEEALRAATENDDLQPTLRLVEALRNPYEVAAGNRELQTPPRPEERVTKTFCGT